MTHASTKMKRKHKVAIYENKHEWGRHKGKGYTIATSPKVNSVFFFFYPKTKRYLYLKKNEKKGSRNNISWGEDEAMHESRFYKK